MYLTPEHPIMSFETIENKMAAVSAKRSVMKTDVHNKDLTGTLALKERMCVTCKCPILVSKTNNTSHSSGEIHVWSPMPPLSILKEEG